MELWVIARYDLGQAFDFFSLRFGQEYSWHCTLDLGLRLVGQVGLQFMDWFGSKEWPRLGIKKQKGRERKAAFNL
jgi:hypothetical protein